MEIYTYEHKFPMETMKSKRSNSYETPAIEQKNSYETSEERGKSELRRNWRALGLSWEGWNSIEQRRASAANCLI